VARGGRSDGAVDIRDSGGSGSGVRGCVAGWRWRDLLLLAGWSVCAIRWSRVSTPVVWLSLGPVSLLSRAGGRIGGAVVRRGSVGAGVSSVVLALTVCVKSRCGGIAHGTVAIEAVLGR
jgi:hypothetical protein